MSRILMVEKKKGIKVTFIFIICRLKKVTASPFSRKVTHSVTQQQYCLFVLFFAQCKIPKLVEQKCRRRRRTWR
jgi:hypothetical protein